MKKAGGEERRKGNRKARRQQNIEKREEKQLMEKYTVRMELVSETRKRSREVIRGWRSNGQKTVQRR